jgi:hypothetical protein
VVVNDFDVERLVTTIGPFETDSPLIVDFDAILARAIATELFEAISWRLAKVNNACCLFKPVKCDFRSSSWYSRESSDMLAVSELGRITITEFWSSCHLQTPQMR